MTITARVDAKAGYSSWCRRDQHRTCTTVNARCTCRCHGQQPTPPAPASKKETVMPTAAQVTELRPPPADVEQETSRGGHVCPDCGKIFERPQGLGAHRARTHGYRANGPAKPDGTKKTDTKDPTQDDRASHADTRHRHQGGALSRSGGSRTIDD